MKFEKLSFGIPREIMAAEKRVAVIPETVKKLTEQGARVVIESGAGEDSFFMDEEYRKAGAEIARSTGEVYDNAEVFLKVKEPRFNEDLGKHEAELLPESSTLICFLHPANPSNHGLVKQLAERNITSLSLDSIPRISRAQKMDALTSMSTIAGYKGAIWASYYLSKFFPMMPTAFGMIPPAKVLVIGTGVAGLQSIATAKRLGGSVKAVDIRPEANEQAKSLGAEVIPFEVPEELAVGKGGYAQRLPEEWYFKEREFLSSYVQDSDVVILTALIPGEEAPILVDSDMISKMQKGSVIIDISADQGGNCELTRSGQEYYYQGVFISGLLNIPATLPVHSTWMFAHNLWHFVDHLVTEGKIDTSSEDEIIRESLVTVGGKIIHQGTLLAMEEAEE